MSRNGNAFKSFRDLCSGLAREREADAAFWTEKSLYSEGKPRFADVLFRRAEPRFYAFDLL